MIELRFTGCCWLWWKRAPCGRYILCSEHEMLGQVRWSRLPSSSPGIYPSLCNSFKFVPSFQIEIVEGPCQCDASYPCTDGEHTNSLWRAGIFDRREASGRKDREVWDQIKKEFMKIKYIGPGRTGGLVRIGHHALLHMLLE